MPRFGENISLTAICRFAADCEGSVNDLELVEIVSEVVKAGVSIGLAYWGLKHGLVELVEDVYGYIHRRLKS